MFSRLVFGLVFNDSYLKLLVFEPFQATVFEKVFERVFEKTVFEFSRKTVFEAVFVIKFYLFSRKLFSSIF